MADLRDERGNPIQLTDEHGNPVQLTDEYGNPMHITGVATAAGAPLPHVSATETKDETSPHSATDIKVETDRTKDEQPEQPRRTSSSSSSSSEDDGQGGRRKKKGLTEKIKEKLTGGKHRDKHYNQQAHTSTTATATTTTTGSTASTSTPGQAEQGHEHEKKSMMEKIKEKLPGHHQHHHA